MLMHAPIGTPLMGCIEKAHPYNKDFAVILGGPMMGRMLSDKDEIRRATVTKTLGNLLVLPKDHYLVTRSKRSIERIRMQTRSACIQCRMCTDLCPRYIDRTQHQAAPDMRNLYREETITDDAEFLRTYGDAAIAVPAVRAKCFLPDGAVAAQSQRLHETAAACPRTSA